MIFNLISEKCDISSVHVISLKMVYHRKHRGLQLRKQRGKQLTACAVWGHTPTCSGVSSRVPQGQQPDGPEVFSPRRPPAAALLLGRRTERPQFPACGDARPRAAEQRPGFLWLLFLIPLRPGSKALPMRRRPQAGDASTLGRPGCSKGHVLWVLWVVC